MASLLKNIAEPYNKDKVYNTKDMVLYNNLLYLCIYNNVSGEFNSSKWIEVQLTDLVQGKLRGIEDYSGKVVDASYIEQDDNYTYFGVPQKAFVDNETSFRTLNSNLVKYGEPIVEFRRYNNNPVYTYTANKSHDVLFVLAGSSNGTANNLSYSFTGESLYSYTYPVSERVRMTAQIVHCNEGDTITLRSVNAFECMFVLELN